MKQLTLLVFAFCCFSSFGQSNVTHVSAKTTNFYIKVDTNWVEIDTVGVFYREIEISSDNSMLILNMHNSVTIESYTYAVDEITKAKGTTYYYCRDEWNFPIMCEMTEDFVGLYYYYDAKTNEFEKAERMIVQSSR